MKSIEEIRRENLLAVIRDRCNGSQTAAATTLGYERPTLVNHWAKGRKEISTPTARKIEEAFGLGDFWMDSEHTSAPGDAPITEEHDALIKRLLPEGKGNVLVWENEADLPHDPERVWIDRFDYHFSAGDGLIQWEVREKKALPFDIGYFRALGSNPKDCRLLAVRGDSMEPYLFNRDMMMIDSTRTNVRDGRVYAVYFEDEPLVKQIFKQVGGGVVLHSYNTKYPDKEVQAESMGLVKIVGEVIHRSGSGLAGGN